MVKILLCYIGAYLEDQTLMKKATKKELLKHCNWVKKKLVHSEGKHYCDCRIRKFRNWLGIKLNGTKQDS